jgi:hypothetical protein
MRVKHLATKNTMAKTSSATSWVRSAITKKEVEKARMDGLISAQDSIKFPSTEQIPEPPSGYRVMFLAFLLRGLIAGLMAPEKSWCLVECPARWEPQEEGVMNIAAKFSLS